MGEWQPLSSHTKRLITGVLVLVPLLGIIVAGPPWAWTATVLVAAFLGLREFQQLLIPEVDSSWNGRCSTFPAEFSFLWGRPWVGRPGCTAA